MRACIGWVLVALVIAGCSSREGDLFQQNKLVKINAATTQRYLDPTQVDEYYKQREAGNEAAMIAVRDDFISGLMAIIDYDYYQYELRLSNTVRGINTSMEVVGLGLTATAAFVNGEQAKSTLAALATLLGGTRLAIDKNMFYNTTLPLLVGRMQAVRETRRTEMVEKRGSSTKLYPLNDALSDVYKYYQAGTITGASADIARENGTTIASEQSKQNNMVTNKAPK